MSSYRLGRGVILWTLLFLFTVPKLVHAQTRGPGGFAGVMTRWQTSTSIACENTYKRYANEKSCPKSLMFSITPDFDGLTLYDWVNSLATAGVNTGVIYVMPSGRLSTKTVINQGQWVAYNQDIYLAPNTLSDNQKQTILQVSKDISKLKYTVVQRNYAILTFLAQLQSAFPSSNAGQIHSRRQDLVY